MQVTALDARLSHLSVHHVQQWLAGHKRLLSAAAGIAVALLAFAALHHLLHEVRGEAIGSALTSLTGRQLVASLGLSALSYLLLTFYDVLALRLIERRLPYTTAALASFTSYTLSHNLGLSLLTGGTARYRIYSAAGLGPADIARVVVAASLSFWAGVVAATAIALLAHAEPLTVGTITIAPEWQRVIGGLLLLLLTAAGAHGRTLRVFGWSLPLPRPGQAALQTLVAVADLAAASGALLVLLPTASPTAMPAFFLAYALAMLTALFTHVPGGLGVFEAVIVVTLPGVPLPSLLAALIAYRLIYYLLPLLAALAILALHEGKQVRRLLRQMSRRAAALFKAYAAHLFAALALGGGLVLLISGATPAVPQRLHYLRAILPLPFVEASQIAASLAGTGLLLLASGLYRRLDGAFHLTRLLLIAGAIFSLAKGMDYEEALVVSGIALLLQCNRATFYRRTALTAAVLSPGWIAAVTAAIAVSICVGMIAYRHVEFDDQLWWHFAWSGDAPRFLRASFGAGVLLTAAMIARLLAGASPRPSERELTPPSFAEVARSSRTDAFLALTGDKRFLHGPQGSFLMYQVKGCSWIVMGDPVGPRECWPGLVWALRERADAAQGRLLFYQITSAMIPLAIDLGLTLIKYGEEAIVPLATFGLAGPAFKPLRHAQRRAEKEGATFEIVPAAAVPQLLPHLKAVSDEWLRGKGHREKAFSMGRFDPAYLARFDFAVVRWQGRIVAFANILATAGREELSVDLMRHRAEIPYGTMDFLFARLMAWGRDQGFQRFNLGVTPLAGITDRRLAPFWARACGRLYRHGGAFYGFAGLRAYKQKFQPTWQPRYIAGTPGFSFVRGLIDLRTLVSGRGRGAPRYRRSPVSKGLDGR